jgi:LmbE family N-acetylglucosaminyl deacetylase
MRVLVLSPHPDDEAIGCGGTLCRHAERGDDVRVVFLTSGERGGHGESPSQTAAIREAEARDAGAILGVRQMEFWNAPDGQLGATDALVKRLVSLVKDWQPELLFTTHPGESHVDHRAAAELTQYALRRSGAPRPVVRLFEIWTPLQQINHVEDISAYMETKLRAIRAYKSQCAAMRFDEAARGLNRYRGEMHSWPGGDYAEVFAGMQP